MSSVFEEALLSLLSRPHYDFLKTLGNAADSLREHELVSTALDSNAERIRSRLENLSIQNATSTASREALTELICLYLNGRPLDHAIVPLQIFTRAAKTVADKRLGYLLCCLLHDWIKSTKDGEEAAQFSLSLVNSLRKDLQSDNEYIIMAALMTAKELLDKETVAGILADVSKLRDHSNPIVRRKTLELMFQSSNANTLLQAALSDSDLQLKFTAIRLLLAETQLTEGAFELIPQLNSLLSQLLSGAAGSEYDYHKVPAPWAISSILRLFNKIATNTKSTQQLLSIMDVAKQCIDCSINWTDAGFFILLSSVDLMANCWKCLLTLSNNNENHQLEAIKREITEMLSNIPKRFLSAENNNLRYIGVALLQAMFPVDAKIIQLYQMEVIECLECQKDETLQLKALELLIMACNSRNCEIIISKCLETLQRFTRIDRTKFLLAIVGLMEKYFESNLVWTILKAFEDFKEFQQDSALLSAFTRIIKSQVVVGTETVNICKWAAKTLQSHPSTLPQQLANVCLQLLSDNCSATEVFSDLIKNYIGECREVDLIATIEALLDIGGRVDLLGANRQLLTDFRAALCKRLESITAFSVRLVCKEYLKVIQSDNLLREFYNPEFDADAAIHECVNLIEKKCKELGISGSEAVDDNSNIIERFEFPRYFKEEKKLRFEAYERPKLAGKEPVRQSFASTSTAVTPTATVAKEAYVTRGEKICLPDGRQIDQLWTIKGLKDIRASKESKGSDTEEADEQKRLLLQKEQERIERVEQERLKQEQELQRKRDLAKSIFE